MAIRKQWRANDEIRPDRPAALQSRSIVENRPRLLKADRFPVLNEAREPA